MPQGTCYRGKNAKSGKHHGSKVDYQGGNDVYPDLLHDLMKENTHDFSNSESLRSYITHILYHLYENRSYLSGLLSEHNENIFMDYMRQQLYELFRRNVSLPESSVPHDYLLNHMVSDFAETVGWWMKHQEYSPEEIIEFYLITTPYLNAD